MRRCASVQDIDVLGTVRREATAASSSGSLFAVGDIGPSTDWGGALAGVDVVIHTAARVHRLGDRAPDPMSEYRRVNVAGTTRLAHQAAAAGVKRLVFLSSIKVNGEATSPDRPFTAYDTPAPADAYGRSKQEAEESLLEVSAKTGLEVVIIRPVLVYGPGVRANFLSMMRWLQRGVPLPLGALQNRRSLVALDNLTDLIVGCLQHPGAANKVLLVSDGQDLSTSDLLRRTAAAMGKRPRLIPVPPRLLCAVGRLVGGRDLTLRLCGSLQVDIGPTKEQVGWSPPIGVDDALRRTVAAFLRENPA
jgi:UDP-glucose 4-epimerase